MLCRKEAVLKGSDLLNTDTDKVQAVDVSCLTHLKKKKKFKIQM